MVIACAATTGSGRFPWIVESALKNRHTQFVIDGEAVTLGAGSMPAAAMSRSRHDQGRSEAAIECSRKAVQVAPDYSDAMFNLALLLQRKNQCAEAADYWRRYLAIGSQSEWG